MVRGLQLGAGGQGRVHELHGRPHLVIKEFDKPIPNAFGEFVALVDSHGAVKDRLTGARVDLCWPLEVQREGGAVTGYVMPRMPEQYYFITDRRHTRTERSLDWAIKRPAALNLPFDVTDHHRFLLTLQVAYFLEAMHANGLVYGDISWRNFSFQIEPEVRISVHDFDSARIIGRPAPTRSPAVDTIDWNDPEVLHYPVCFDTDRYKFALLAYRLMVSRTLYDRIDPTQVHEGLLGLELRQVRHIRSLFIRANGPQGTRPTILEWIRSLEV